MFTVQTIRIAVLLVIALLYDTCSGYPSIRQKQEIASHCKGCGDFCHKCEYGVVMSSVCGISQCAKAKSYLLFQGPDEPCGGPRELFGTCGEGMRCTCNQCTGCSSENLRCSKVQNPCLRDVNIFGRWPTIM
ncbi:Neuroparsin-A [Melipona quadrifasciata]|uniref:Neuroparsin-A n=1 Tax=Melipona quadrifasciata TaxID=166423 RepID=A0A0M9A194_9HYME|nr:Neuroparsin-A [Melipona quadrifasciata]